MKTIARKRMVRELKKNALRYLALFLLIAFGMYLIISMVASADNITIAEEQSSKDYKREDGQFEVFVPLSEANLKQIENDGITIEPMFYMDFKMEGEGTLRVYQIRKEMDLVNVFEGELAKREDEVVIERNYARENAIKVGQEVTFGGRTCKVVGIVTTLDYETPLKEFSDTTAQSKTFGTVFVTKEGYEAFAEKKTYVGTEKYTYAYRLNGAMTDRDLKERLLEQTIEKEDVTDSYFTKMIDEIEETKTNLEDGIRKLREGADELHNGLDTLKDNNDSLKKGAEGIVTMYLSEANRSLPQLGVSRRLTKENYKDVLEREIRNAGGEDTAAGGSLSAIKQKLDALVQYADGVSSYTKGEKDATKGAKELAKGISDLEKNTRRLMNETFSIEIKNMTSFLKAADNPRIEGAIDDVVINKYAGIIAGVIVIILFTFVISVFVIHGIEQENTIIGALYALGVEKKELMVQYLLLPVCITLLGGIVGTLIGFSDLGMVQQEQDTVAYFSLPEIPKVYPLYLIVYGVVMPPVIAAIVNFLVINKKLGEAPLKLLRNEKKQRRVKKLKLNSLPYMKMFQVRQFLRELRSGIAIVFGMLISLLIVMIGLNCYAVCMNMANQTKEDTKYSYMYSYKYPTKKAPKGGEACYMESLKKEAYGYNLDVTLLGIDEKNKYFDFQVGEGKNKVSVSSSAAIKYNLSVGDKLVLSDEVKEQDYAFTVEEIVPYSVGLYVFMDIDSMRELFGKEDDYYNVVYADKKLEVEEGRLYATTKKEDIIRNSNVFIENMTSMIVMMAVIGTVIFIVVMYLMMKVAIDRSASSIALMKVFGYQDGEIRKLYLNGNFYLIAVGGIVSMYISKVVMDAMYPYLVANVAAGMDLHLDWWIYLVLYAGILACYLLINGILVHRLRKVSPNEVLKNRE